MRNLKRFLAMALTMLMVIGSFSMSAFAFNDTADSKFEEAIDALAEIGVVKGVDADNYNPDGDVTRWQAALLMSKLASGKGLVGAGEDNFWYAEENTTDFTDVTAEHYLGSIAYASNYNFIVGFIDPTTGKPIYKPTNDIKFQEALTMAVRALGYDYGTAGYPWKFISKAISLGLDENLTDVAYTDTLTRGEYAQLLFNLLYTENVKGTSYAQDNFNYLPVDDYVTVVITSNTTYSILNDTEKPAKSGYVGFNLLNPNGTIDESITYYLPASEFEGTPAPKDSYSVYTTDNFQSLEDSVKCDSKTFTKTGDAKFAFSGKTAIVIDGKTYDLVTSYSYLYNNQGNKGNNPEIILDVVTETATLNNTGDQYARDIYYNILNSKGEVALYYMPTLTGSYTQPYVMDIGAGKYETKATLADLVAAYNAVNTTATIKTALNGQAANYKTITTTDAEASTAYTYADLVVYDDNGDGVYDRAYYAGYKFSYSALETGDGKAFNGYTFTGTNGSNILYTFDKLAKTVIVKPVETTTQTGYVSQVDGSIVINGVAYSKKDLGGYGATNTANLLPSYLGANITVTLWDGQIIAVNNGTNANFIIYNEMVGVAGNGYPIALVYNGSTTLSQITIATVNGVNWMQYFYNYRGTDFTTIYDLLDTGSVYTGYADVYGYYHITELNYANPGSSWNIYSAGDNDNYDNGNNAITNNNGYVAVQFDNGIAHADLLTFNNRFAGPWDMGPNFNMYSGSRFYEVYTDYAKIFKDFTVDAKTQFIMALGEDHTGETFAVATGIPTNGSKVIMETGEYDWLLVYFGNGTDKPATLVYAWDGAFDGSFNANNGTTMTDYDTIVYVDKTTVLTKVTNVNGTIGTTGTILGAIYTYNRAIDMVNGGYTTVAVTALYNSALEAGCFYKVRQGYIAEKVFPEIEQADEVETGIAVALLKYVDNSFCYINRELKGPAMGDDLYASWGATTIYTLGLDGVVAHGNVNNVDTLTASTAYSGTVNGYVPVYYYTGKLAHKNILLALPTGTTMDFSNLTVTPAYNAANGVALVNNKFPAATATTTRVAFELTAPQYNKLMAEQHYTLDPSATNYQVAVLDMFNLLKIYDATGADVTEDVKLDIATNLFDNVSVGNIINRGQVTYYVTFELNDDADVDAALGTLTIKYLGGDAVQTMIVNLSKLAID